MSLINKFDGNLNVIGNSLRKHRLEKGLSYEALSAKLELIGISIHKQSLYDIEINKRTVKDYELFALANVLGININELFADMREKLHQQENR